MCKLSNFNYFIPEEDRVIYFNGISTEVFSLNEKEHQRMQALFADVSLFEQNYPSVFERFKKWGFIVSDTTNEIDLLQYRNRQIVFNDKNYMLVVNPTLECNFHCWYCYEEHPQGYMSEETIEKLKKHMVYMVEKEKITSLNLSWFGGEPLLYFDEVVYPLSRYGKELCEKNGIPFSNGITTNASRIDEVMIERIKEIELFHFQITLDGDKERHNKIRNEGGKPSFDKIIGNINLLIEQVEDVRITLRINYDARTLEVCDMRQVFESVDEKFRYKVRVDFQRVWQTVTTYEEENERRLELYNTCSLLGYNQTEIANVFSVGLTHKCYTDRFYHAEFNYDGKVYRCTARGYGDEYVIGELSDTGNIEWDEEKMAKRYRKATFENKMCLACKYLPLCMGPCSQKITETPEGRIGDACYLNHAEVAPETVILDYYHQKMNVVQKRI